MIPSKKNGFLSRQEVNTLTASFSRSILIESKSKAFKIHTKSTIYMYLTILVFYVFEHLRCNYFLVLVITEPQGVKNPVVLRVQFGSHFEVIQSISVILLRKVQQPSIDQNLQNKTQQQL
jgi:hypothetical protein